jgi:hypothetical protein
MNKKIRTMSGQHRSCRLTLNLFPLNLSTFKE